MKFLTKTKLIMYIPIIGFIYICDMVRKDYNAVAPWNNFNRFDAICTVSIQSCSLALPIIYIVNKYL
jgi:hypothetical protein